jgi:hypothetical protein
LSKKHIFYNKAERLYVYEFLGIEEVASRLNLGSRTIRNWKDENDWDKKKREYLKSKLAFHEELYEFARKLMYSIQEDLASGEKVDPGRMFAFTRMLPLITKIKEYEDVAVKKEQTQENKGLTEDIVKLIEEEVLGITGNAGV